MSVEKLFINGKEITPPEGVKVSFYSSEIERVRKGLYFWKCPKCGCKIGSEKQLLKIADKIDAGNCGMRFVHLHCPECNTEWIQPL